MEQIKCGCIIKEDILSLDNIVHDLNTMNFIKTVDILHIATNHKTEKK